MDKNAHQVLRKRYESSSRSIKDITRYFASSTMMNMKKDDIHEADRGYRILILINRGRYRIIHTYTHI